MARGTIRAVLVALVLATAAPVRAHPLVEQGIERARDADFIGALQSFALAERARDLTREDLISLLEGRAYVQFALRQNAPLRRTLMALASLAPQHELGALVPPPVRELFAEIVGLVGEPLELELERVITPTEITLTAAVTGDVESLVESIRIFAQVDDGHWDFLEDERTLNRAAGRVILVYAEAYGPGRAVVASVGSAESPLSFSGLTPLAAPEPSPPVVPAAEASHSFVGWAIAGGVLGGALLASVIAVLLGGRVTDDTAVDIHLPPTGLSL